MKKNLLFLFLLCIVLPLTVAYVIDPSAQGYNSRTFATNYEMLVQSFNTANVTPLQTIGGVQYSLPPFYTSSSSCGPADFHSSCGFSGNLTNYCLVSDETSQWALTMAMSQNTSMNDEFNAMINTILAWNLSSTNSLTEWKTGYHAQSGGIINKSIVSDTASDADARFITALLIANDSNAPFNSSTKARAGSLGAEMCADFIASDFLNIVRTSNSNSSYSISYWPCGGTNVCTALTNNDFMFTGYHGDIAMALGKCGEYTNNSIYFTIARDTVESYLAASNWTPTSGLKFPPGRSYKWANAGAGQTPYAVDTSGVPYVDDPDGKRITSLCTAEYQFNQKGRVLHPQLTKYCLDWANQSVITNITYPAEWRPEGVNFSASSDSFSNNGLALQLDIYKNQSRAVQRLNYTFNNKWDNTNNRYFGTTCQGLYNPSFVSHSMGYLLGYGDYVMTGPAAATPTLFSSVLMNITVPGANFQTVNSSFNVTADLRMKNYSVNFNTFNPVDYSFGVNNETGVYIYANRNFTLTHALLNASSGGNQFRVRDSGYTLLYSASITAQVATVNYNFTAGNFYYVTMLHHANPTPASCGSSSSLPSNYSFFSIINGTHDGRLNNSEICNFQEFKMTDANPYRNVSSILYYSNGTLARYITQTFSNVINGSYTQNITGLPVDMYRLSLYGCQSNSACNQTANVSFLFGSQFFGMRSVNTTGEGVTNTFSVNLTLASGYPTQAQLIYNNTQYSGSITNYAGNNYTFSANVLSPNIANGSVNITWYWNVSTSTNGLLETSKVNQTVTAFNLDDCTTNTVQIMNLTLRDEDAQTLITPNGVSTNATIEVDLSVYAEGSSVLVQQFSKNFTNRTQGVVCIGSGVLNSSSYRMDGIIRYESTSRVSEFYNIQSYNLSNSTIPNTINLYDLAILRSQEFLITVKDENFLLLGDALVTVTRKYIDEGQFKTVEVPKTDSSGQALAHLVLSDVIYTFIVQKDGVILGTFEDYVVSCEDQTTGNCRINLNLLQSNTQPYNSSGVGNLFYTVDFNRTSRTFTVPFSTTDGSGRVVFLNVSTYLGSSTELCSTTVTGSSGQLSCTISASQQNGTAVFSLFSNGQLVTRGYVSYGLTGDDIYGGTTKYVLLILVFMVIVLLAISGGQVLAVIGLVSALVVALLFNLMDGFNIIGVGASLIGIICIGVIILMKKKEGVL